MEKMMIFGSETNEKEVNLKWIELYRKIRMNFNDTFSVISLEERKKKNNEYFSTQWTITPPMLFSIK